MNQIVSYCLEVYIWMYYDVALLGHTDTFRMTCSLFECAGWFTVQVTQLWCFSQLWETLCHRSLVWRLNIGLLLRLDLFICHPTMHWEIEREGGCLEEQQQGSFSQMDMCLLWDVSSSVTVMRTALKKIDSFLQGPLYSKQSNSASIISQFSTLVSILLISGDRVVWWMLTDKILLSIIW